MCRGLPYDRQLSHQLIKFFLQEAVNRGAGAAAWEVVKFLDAIQHHIAALPTQITDITIIAATHSAAMLRINTAAAAQSLTSLMRGW